MCEKCLKVSELNKSEKEWAYLIRGIARRKFSNVERI